MKINQAAYLTLKAAVTPFLASSSPSERERWDALWNSGLDIGQLYATGLNDNHIDTALRNIAKELAC